MAQAGRPSLGVNGLDMTIFLSESSPELLCRINRTVGRVGLARSSRRSSGCDVLLIGLVAARHSVSATDGDDAGRGRSGCVHVASMNKLPDPQEERFLQAQEQKKMSGIAVDVLNKCGPLDSRWLVLFGVSRAGGNCLCIPSLAKQCSFGPC